MKNHLFIILLVSNHIIWSQSIHFNMTGQTDLAWNLSDIVEIRYGPTDMIVEFTAGGVFELPYNQIISFQFKEFNVSVSEQKLSNVNNITLYPNPTNDYLALRYELNGSDQIIAEVFHMDGRMVKEEILGFRPQGLQRESIDVSGLSAGSYLLKLFGNSWSTVIPWAKQSRD